MLDQDNLQTAANAAAAPAANVSTFARFGLLMYTFLIVYASLYPFSNWHDLGLSPWDFLLMPLPHYWTRFDVAVNVIGYFPFGMLLVFALYPRIRGLLATVIAILGGVLLSGSLEAVQTFLPSRVSSNLDFMTNLAGAVIGAVAGALLSRTFLEQSRLLQLRKEWFLPEAGRGLIIAGLWPLAQIYPQGYLFGHGELTPILSDWLPGWTDAPVNLLAWLSSDVTLTVQQYWLAETLITAFGMTGALLTGSILLRKQAPRIALLVSLLAAALAAKTMASAIVFAPANAFAWMTPGAEGGILIGTMMVGGLSYAPAVAQRRIAIACLLLSFLAINLLPANPYFLSTLQAWIQGKFLNFNGAAHFLSVFWPVFTLWFLLHPSHRLKRG